MVAGCYLCVYVRVDGRMHACCVCVHARTHARYGWYGIMVVFEGMSLRLDRGWELGCVWDWCWCWVAERC